MNKKTIVINGNNFSDLESFYDEMDRVLTKDLDWQTGHNLDAFNDLLWGGFGIHEYEESIILHWKNISKSKSDFGFGTTRLYYEKRIANSKINTQDWKEELKKLIDGNGQTFFDIIVEIISRHEHIEFNSED